MAASLMQVCVFHSVTVISKINQLMLFLFKLHGRAGTATYYVIYRQQKKCNHITALYSTNHVYCRRLGPGHLLTVPGANSKWIIQF